MIRWQFWKFSKDNFGIASLQDCRKSFSLIRHEHGSIKIGFCICWLLWQMLQKFSAFVPHLPKCSITRGTHLDTYVSGTSSSEYFFIFFSSLVAAAWPFSLLALLIMSRLRGWAKDTSRSKFCPVFRSNIVMCGWSSVLMYWCLGSVWSGRWRSDRHSLHPFN